MSETRPGYRVTLCDCERTLLDEIAIPTQKRRDIAQTYALALQSPESATMNWGSVNRAIIARWSMAGLLWIKKQAWSGKCFK